MISRRYSKDSEKTFILVISLIFILLTFFVIKDIFALIVYSLILSYFLYPLYKYYLSKTNSKRLSSILTLSTATIFFLIPLGFLAYFLILNLVKIVIDYRVYIQNPELLNEVVGNFVGSITSSPLLTNLDYSLFVQPVVRYIIDLSTGFFSSLPILFLYLFIVLFISYYVLIHGKSMITGFNEYIPLSLKKQNEILRNITKNLTVLFRGYFLTGVIQTFVAFVGYVIFGVPNLLIVTFLTFITTLIPYLGTPMVWIPVAFYLILTGETVFGIGLLLYGTFVISLVDNFVRPILMSHKDTISPPMVFIGIIGGLFAFGIQGIILGPIIISITLILIRYLKETYELRV